MILTLEPELSQTLEAEARRRGLSPEQLAVTAIREKLFLTRPKLEPRDDWERRLLSLGRDRGVSLSNEALSSEGLYE